MSWVWPMRAERLAGRSGELELRYESGRLVLNTAHANQSFGSLHRVWQQVFRLLALRDSPPEQVLLLGLGGGSVPSILRQELRIASPLTAVEIDPVMVRLARTHFGLDRLEAIDVIEGDALVQVQALRDRYDLVVVDLFEDLDLARGVDTMGFAHALRDRCSGTLCFNTVGYDAPSTARCERVKTNLTKVFGTVDEWCLEGVNRVFIGH